MWQRLIQDIRKKHYTFERIGDLCGLKKNSVHNLFTGLSTEPKGNAALKLIDLHRSLYPRKYKGK